MTQDSSKANQDGPKNATENAPEKVSDKALDHASEKKSPAPKAAPAAKVSKPADRASVAKTKPVGRTNQVKFGLLWVVVLLLIVMVAGLGLDRPFCEYRCGPCTSRPHRCLRSPR